MAKQIEGVYDAVLACAKEEFLEKGYQDASLRTIAQKAGTSTSSIYTRFRDKEGLFETIVEPALRGMMEQFVHVQEAFHSFDGETQLRNMAQYTSREMSKMLDYMYDNLDAFRLLLDASYGTRFQHFVDELVRIEVEYTYKFMEAVGYPMEGEDAMTKNLLHIVTTSYFEGLFEVIRHGMGREDAKKYMLLLGNYHHAGFTAVFYPEK